MIGSTSASIALMGKRGVGYDLTFNGGFTFSSSGAEGLGVNGYANTNFSNITTVANDYSFGVYQYTGNVPSKTEECLMGNFSFNTQTPELLICSNNGPNNYAFRSGTATLVSASNGGNIPGLYIGNRTGSTTSELYRNGNLTPILILTANTYTESTGVDVFLWNINIGGPYGNGFANQGLNFAFIGKGLTISDVNNLSTIINTFQTTLGRNIY